MNIKLPYQNSNNDYYYYDVDRKQVNCLGYYHPANKTHFLFAKKDGKRASFRFSSRWSLHINEIRQFVEKELAKASISPAARVKEPFSSVTSQISALQAQNLEYSKRISKLEATIANLARAFNK